MVDVLVRARLGWKVRVTEGGGRIIRHALASSAEFLVANFSQFGLLSTNIPPCLQGLLFQPLFKVHPRCGSDDQLYETDPPPLKGETLKNRRSKFCRRRNKELDRPAGVKY